MANPSDGSGKGPQKPTPIIDLKATEVKGDDAGKAATGNKPGTPTPASSAKPGETKPVAPVTSTSVPNVASSKATDGKPQAAGTPPSGAASASAAKPADKVADKSGDKTTDKPDAAKAAPVLVAKAEPRRSGGMVGALTHMVAGLAGGVLALFGAETIQTQLGGALNLPHSKAEQIAADLGKRIAAVEASTRQGGASAGADKLAAAERRIAELEQSTRAIGELKDGQTALAAQAKALEGKIGTTTGEGAAPAELTERLAKLEQSLATLASAAGTNGQGGGRIAQLASISGKLTDLEGNLATQLAALRKSVMTELETRVAQTAEASEAARAGTQRLDRDMATLKTEAARLAQRGETLRATDERFDKTLRVVQEETGTLKSSLDELKGDLLAQLKSVARPKDVATALAPVNDKIAGIEKDLAGVVKSETDRKVNAERVVLALELANLKRVVERGGSYAKELGELKASAGSKLNLAALDKFKDKGVATTPELAAEFRAIAHQLIAAADEKADAGVVDRLLSGAKSIVKVRSTNPTAADTSTEATVARIEARLKEGSLAAAVDEAGKLPAKAKAPAAGWLDRVTARAEIEQAIAALEAQLKASLGGAASNTKG